jgi:very-short-patch-repair endonuclease
VPISAVGSACLRQTRRMEGEADLVKLRRDLQGPAEAYVTGHTHEYLDAACERLGLPVLAREEGAAKRERFERCFAALPDESLPAVAERILGLEGHPLDAKTRNAIQDGLWAGQQVPETPLRTRREIAEALEPQLQDLVERGNRFRMLLDRFWVLDTEPLSFLLDDGTGLRAQIDQHVFCNPGDWPVVELFERLGALEAHHPRFARFLVALVSADTIPDVRSQRRLVEILKSPLQDAGAELRETGEAEGYPVFSMVSMRARRSRPPRALIFATLSKPDIRIGDALDLDIEILGSRNDVLFYDRPIDGEGLLWRDLHCWWKETRQITDDVRAKKALYQRLKECLPARLVEGEKKRYPAQENLFELYYDLHARDVPGLPALLPEVWVHWDPKTMHARGDTAMTHHRMDFLLLLPGGHRVVLEVDGIQHYSSAQTTDGWRNAKADRKEYARTVRGDRDLKLSGYEVFRFGTAELEHRDAARQVLRGFFADLFREYKVAPQ